MELQFVDPARIPLDVGGDRVGGVLVVLGLDQVEQLVGADQPFGQLADPGDGLVQQRAFAPQRLRAVGVVPDVGILEFPVDFLEALYPCLVVKETP